MRRLRPLDRLRKVPGPVRWACVILIGLLLYNPFLAMSLSSGGLNVWHPFSHRATDAASEMQHYSASGGLQILFVALVVALCVFFFVLTIAVCWRFDRQETVLSKLERFSSNLWVRPPPVLS